MSRIGVFTFVRHKFPWNIADALEFFMGILVSFNMKKKTKKKQIEIFELFYILPICGLLNKWNEEYIEKIQNE